MDLTTHHTMSERSYHGATSCSLKIRRHAIWNKAVRTKTTKPSSTYWTETRDTWRSVVLPLRWCCAIGWSAGCLGHRSQWGHSNQRVTGWGGRGDSNQRVTGWGERSDSNQRVTGWCLEMGHQNSTLNHDMSWLEKEKKPYIFLILK